MDFETWLPANQLRKKQLVDCFLKVKLSYLKNDITLKDLKNIDHPT